jgi:prevent-host-death family protein
MDLLEAPMTQTRFSEDIRAITDLKAHAAEIVDHARRTRRPVLLTRRSRGVAVLLSLDEYEALTDRATFVAAVEEGAEAARRGDLVPHEEAVRVLDSFGE